MDFTFTLTRNQPITWSAATGQVLGGTRMVAQAFGLFPDGSTRPTGELKCFAIGADAQGNVGQINFNQLFGTAAIVIPTRGRRTSTTRGRSRPSAGFRRKASWSARRAILDLDGTITGYDLCPNILVAAFQPAGQAGGFPVGAPPGFALPAVRSTGISSRRATRT